MAFVSTNDFKSGIKVLMDGDPYSIIENEFVKPGKGQAFNRVRMRNLKTGRMLDKTFKSGDTLEAADVVDVDMTFLYSDGEHLHFMSPTTYEQHEVPAAVVGDMAQWLKEQDSVIVTMWNGIPLTITPPNFVNLTVTETDPGVRGDTVSGGNKAATMETGAVIRVPLFINIGDVLRIDTRTGEYISRAKE
jgi:elongation factor P